MVDEKVKDNSNDVWSTISDNSPKTFFPQTLLPGLELNILNDKIINFGPSFQDILDTHKSSKSTVWGSNRQEKTSLNDKANMFKINFTDHSKRVAFNYPYEQVKIFVKKLIDINIVDKEKFLFQVGKCDSWNKIDFETCKKLIDNYTLDSNNVNFELIKTAFFTANILGGAITQKSIEKSLIDNTNTFQVSSEFGSTSITVGNKKFDFFATESIQSKIDKLSEIINAKHLTINQLSNFTTPELNKDVYEKYTNFINEKNKNLTVGAYLDKKITNTSSSTSSIDMKNIQLSLLNDELLDGKLSNETEDFLDELVNGLKILNNSKKIEEDKIKPEAPVVAQPPINDVEKVPSLSIQEIKDIESSDKIKKEVNKIEKLISSLTIGMFDLDKLVTFGLLTPQGVAAWRIEDQKKNDYFYSDSFMEKFVNNYNSNGWEFIDDITDNKPYTFTSVLKKEASKAGVRIIASKAVSITKELIIKTLPENNSKSIKGFLNSELGNSFIGMMTGLSLSYVMQNNEKAQVIADELRVASLTSLGNEIFDTFITNMSSIIINEVNSISKNEDDQLLGFNSKDELEHKKLFI